VHRPDRPHRRELRQEPPESMTIWTVKATKMAMPHSSAAKISFLVLMAGPAYRPAPQHPQP